MEEERSWEGSISTRTQQHLHNAQENSPLEEGLTFGQFYPTTEEFLFPDFVSEDFFSHRIKKESENISIFE